MSKKIENLKKQLDEQKLVNYELTDKIEAIANYFNVELYKEAYIAKTGFYGYSLVSNPIKEEIKHRWIVKKLKK